MKSNFDSFYGTVLKSCEVAGLTLSETVYPANLRLSRHSHQSAYLCYVLRGKFTEVYGNRSLECERSTLIFHPAGDIHADCFQAASRCLNLKINSDWFDRLPAGRFCLNEPSDFRSGILSHLAARIYGEFTCQDELSALVIEGLTLEILAETFRQSARRFKNAPPPWLKEARDLLHDRFQENSSLSEIARLVGVHPTHLSREFRRYYGCTVGEYLRRLRIEYACGVLAKSGAPIAEIALAAGFFDQSHFSRHFKSRTGMTPHQYRKIWLAR